VTVHHNELPQEQLMKRTMATLPALLLAATAHAHEGHGIAGATHWHAGDTLSFIAWGAAIVAAAWFMRRK
jgi:hypothetical protein